MSIRVAWLLLLPDRVSIAQSFRLPVLLKNRSFFIHFLWLFIATQSSTSSPGTRGTRTWSRSTVYSFIYLYFEHQYYLTLRLPSLLIECYYLYRHRMGMREDQEPVHPVHVVLPGHSHCHHHCPRRTSWSWSWGRWSRARHSQGDRFGVAVLIYLAWYFAWEQIRAAHILINQSWTHLN